MALNLHLKTTGDTIRLGQTLARELAAHPNPPSLLLQGDLGSGKTTLVRGLVESLPGAGQAEVSSPSFNIFNLYPTTPPVAHFDLYRLEGMPPDDALFEHLDAPNTLVVVEWIQYLDVNLWPHEAIWLEWMPSRTGRNLTLHAMGKAAQGMEDSLKAQLKHFI